MKQFITIALVFALIFSIQRISAQDKPVSPNVIINGVFMGETPPLRDIPALTPEEIELMKEKAFIKAANKVIKPRAYPYAETALPKGPDEAWQQTMGKSAGGKAPIVNFEGQTTSSYPPDCNGTAGPSHYMQTVNTTYAIYSKTGTLLAGPTNMNLLFGSVAGANCNDGDPLIQYDEQANRWIAVEFSLCGSNDLMLVAVSSTNDPTGTWYQYSFDVADMPDYEKIGVWQDGYYMGTNTGSGNDIYVLERSKMLNGQPAQMVAFDNPWRPGSGFLCVPPLDNDGVSSPAGSPGMFIAFNDDAVAGGSDQLWLYELAVNWTTPSSSTFNRIQQVNVTAFDSQFTSAWDDITQPNSQKLDGVPQVIMNAPQYRNFGSYQTIVCCHTVDVDATNHAGIRWYELRKTPPSTTWTLRQQGTYAPDIHSRWMGSIMLNGSGKIGMAYSISSSTVYPGIRYCGQSSSAYSSASGVMDIAEEVIHSGTVAQTGYNRWGDYALLSVDPTDDQTFWFTSEYVKPGGTLKGSKVASFKFGNDPAVVTLPATSVTASAATINGTVNPNGLATTCYFEWGTSASYGNSTPVNSVGAGTSNVVVSENLGSLTAGQPYHFRLVATNSDGTSYGGDLSFTPGAAAVTTTAASSVTLNSAISGGNVTSDGGSTVTGRGVCWSTSANPTISDNHTEDGTGTGTFTSTISPLSSNTLYHIRAYATNASGAYYGEDLTFSTLCGIISDFPWSEGFENGGTIPNCWTQEQVNSSGINWTFITGNGSGNPASAHSGTYNACLKDQTTADNKTRLITPPINLGLISSPVLTFWHTQALWSPDQDILTVFYRTSASGTWTQLATYTSSITSWTQRTINLPGSSSEYYICFEGNAKYGRGICVDDVSITGSATTPTLVVTPSNQNVTAAAGSTNFSVTSNSSWTAASDAAWCTVTLSGNGNGTITANYQENTLLTNRVATTTVTVAGLTPVVVTVTQAGTSPTLSVTPSNQNVTAAAGSTNFSVTSNSAWTAASDAAWCTVTLSGSGNGTITANYQENTLLTNRVATITVTVAGLTPLVVTVTQAGTSPMLSVTPSNQNVTAAAGSTNFSVTSNSAWTVDSDAAWCTVTLSGSGNGTITANYQENTLLTNRVATITVTVAGLTPVVVTVTQAGTSPTLSVTPSNQNVTAAAGSTIFSVTSNSSWTAASDAAWCTVTLSGSGNGTITATYQENTLLINRVATITVTVAGLTPVVVTVTQAGTSPTLSVTPSNQNVTAAAGSTNFSVTSNSSWTVASDAAWCTVTISGNGNGTITATYQQNTLLTSRVATITVTVAGLTPVVVTVTQAGTSPTLSVTPFNQNVTAAAGSTNFSVTSNSSWTAASDAAWCTVTISGNGNGTITANYQQNTLLNSRVATITVTVAGLTPVVVTVTQAGTSPTLSVTPSNQNVTAVAGSTNFTVTSNSAWTAASDAAWCTVTPSGNGNGTITAAFSENVMAYTRIANISVTVAGLIPVIVTVTQAAPVAVLIVNPDSQTVVYQAGSVTFDVTSNVNWTSVSDADWCQSTPSGSGNGLLTALFLQNDGTEIRTANIQVMSTLTDPVAVQVIQLPFPVSIDEHAENNIQIYPNPTTGIFVISGFSNEIFNMKVSITDNSGKEVLKRECAGASAYTFDLSGNTEGNYFLKAETTGKVLVWKIIVQ